MNSPARKYARGTRLVFMTLAGISAIVMIAGAMFFMSGAGSLQRSLTIGGLYTVCKPKGYDIVCIGDKSGGLFCLPLKDAGGSCR